MITRRPDDRIIFLAAGLCLDYPNADLLARMPIVAEALSEQRDSSPVRDLRALVDHLCAESLESLQRRYVELFDLSRKCTLYLSYWTDGDTRRRGEVLARFKATYRERGVRFDANGELPDYLPAVLEFAAHVDLRSGRALLVEYRLSLELIRLALHEAKSPYAQALRAVCAMLPGDSPGTRAAALAMAAGGPPTESVGIGP